MSIIGQTPNRFQNDLSDNEFESINLNDFIDRSNNEFNNIDLDIIAYNVRFVNELISHNDRL